MNELTQPTVQVQTEQQAQGEMQVQGALQTQTEPQAQGTPRGNRLHIALFGRTNSGKSSLLNALTNQQTAVVSDTEGTTTDPVYKSMELSGAGALTFIDTAGFGDSTALGAQRLAKTHLVANKCDIALVLFTADAYQKDGFALESAFLRDFAQTAKSTKCIIPILNKTDTLPPRVEAITYTGGACTSEPCTQTHAEATTYTDAPHETESRADSLAFLLQKVAACTAEAARGTAVTSATDTKHTAESTRTARETVTASVASDTAPTTPVSAARADTESSLTDTEPTPADTEPSAPTTPHISAPIAVSAALKTGIESVYNAIRAAAATNKEPPLVTESLCTKGDTVLLVMPQDTQAPKGRLILPQVQVIRALLDASCIAVSCTVDGMAGALNALKEPPRLIITDSKAFKTVWAQKPPKSALTSFSVLLAAQKGDIASFIQGARAIEQLDETSRVLIAESCTHAPLTEDIGRVQIPRLLRAYVEKKKPGAGARLSVTVVSGTDFPHDVGRYSLIVHCGACMFNRAFMLSRQAAAAAARVPMTNYGVCIAYLHGILDAVALP